MHRTARLLALALLVPALLAGCAKPAESAGPDDGPAALEVSHDHSTGTKTSTFYLPQAGTYVIVMRFDPLTDECPDATADMTLYAPDGAQVDTVKSRSGGAPHEREGCGYLRLDAREMDTGPWRVQFDGIADLNGRLLAHRA